MPDLFQDLTPLQVLLTSMSTFVLLTILFALVQGWTWDAMRREPDPWYTAGEEPPMPDGPPEDFDCHLYEQRRN